MSGTAGDGDERKVVGESRAVGETVSGKTYHEL
jgi:hypothetical protein